MFAPSLANERAMARPIPLVEPVTTAVLPANIMVVILWFNTKKNNSTAQTNADSHNESNTTLWQSDYAKTMPVEHRKMLKIKHEFELVAQSKIGLSLQNNAALAVPSGIDCFPDPFLRYGYDTICR